MSEERSQPAPESGRVYRTVTRYWPRIAVGLVLLLGAAEWIIGGLTADTGIEFYLMAWAGTTGGVWFLFEKAETALTHDTRAAASAWISQTGRDVRFGTLPLQFAQLFDRVFGDRHVSKRCLERSAAASFAAVAVTFLVVASTEPALVSTVASEEWLEFPGVVSLSSPGGLVDLVTSFIFVAGLSVFFNLIPDYLSLLETRVAMRFARGGAAKAVGVLIVDLVLTACLSLGWLWVATVLMLAQDGVSFSFQDALTIPLGVGQVDNFTETWAPIATVFFYSAFFTSVWLWLYAASVMVSRVMVRMGGGVGFLLRVTDVEHQPFRSMGFVSVIITSVIFALGLPLVLL